MYLQFWMSPDANVYFSLHLNVIKKHNCELKQMKPSLDQVARPLNANLLNMQQSMFKLTMKTQATKAMAKPIDTNLQLQTCCW